MMFIKVLKPIGSLLEGDVIEVKEDSQHQFFIDNGYAEKTEAPIVEEANPVTTGAYSTASVLKSGTSGAVSDVVNPATIEALATLKELGAELAEKEAEYQALKSDFEKAKADFDAEKLTFDSEKSDFEKAKADFINSKTETVVEPAKGKPGPKAKENK